MHTQQIRYYKNSDQLYSIVCGRGVSKSFPMHRHLSVSIGMVLKGSRMLTIYKHRFVIADGDIFIINSAEPHAISSSNNPHHDYIVVSLSKELISRYISDDISFFNIIDCQELQELLQKLFFTIFTNEKAEIYLDTDLLIKLICSFSYKNLEKKNPNDRIFKTQKLLDNSITENYPLETLAQKAYLSTYHFARLFKNQIGLAPHQYLIDNRLRAARQMLESGKNTSDTAIATGFYDTSHFVRHFQAYFGVTPTEFQKGIINIKG